MKSSTPAQVIDAHLGEKEKTGKHGKVEVKRNWYVLGQPHYFPQGNGRQSPRLEPGETTRCRGKLMEPVRSKAERTSETIGAFHIKFT